MEPSLYDQSMYQGGFGLYTIFYLAILVIFFAADWKIFTKAGKPGWYSLIPIYNMYKFFEISGLNGWWVLAFFVPFLNIFAYFYLAINLAHAFGKSTAYGIVLLAIFGIIGHLMLGFGSAQYQRTTKAVEAAPAKAE